jgi:small subunit ribosomal protein S15
VLPPGKVFVCTNRGPHPPLPLTTTKKQELINGHQTHGTDTGSVEVQVAMLSERIQQLSGHLQKNIHDFSSRQGLLKMIGRRKRLLGYLRAQSEQRYAALIEKLGIRG